MTSIKAFLLGVDWDFLSRMTKFLAFFAIIAVLGNINGVLGLLALLLGGFGALCIFAAKMTTQLLAEDRTRRDW